MLKTNLYHVFKLRSTVVYVAMNSASSSSTYLSSSVSMVERIYPVSRGTRHIVVCWARLHGPGAEQ